MKSPSIVLTGGGSAGHVTPNIALLAPLREKGFDIAYIGSYDGIEKRLLGDFDLPYYGISSGKLRRYFDPQNFKDPFKVIKGYREAGKILRELSPDIVFSKGGYVGVPVVRAAARLKIPCIIHESDMTPGLANRLCAGAAKKICCNFPETVEKLPPGKAVLTGTPIRKELLSGSKEQALAFCGFSPDKPVILVIGGSLGAASVNQVVRSALPKLLPDFHVIHITGKDKIDNLMLRTEGYRQFEYLKSELKDVFALADVVISRAGANAICELLALNKPNLLIPLPRTSSRGDQLLNAASFQSRGFSAVLDEDDLTPLRLNEAVRDLYENRQTYIDNMKCSGNTDAVSTIIELIVQVMKGA